MERFQCDGRILSRFLFKMAFSRFNSRVKSTLQDLETVSMDDFRHNYVNLTGFRLVRYEEPVVRDAIKQMRSYERFSREHLLNTTALMKVILHLALQTCDVVFSFRY